MQGLPSTLAFSFLMMTRVSLSLSFKCFFSICKEVYTPEAADAHLQSMLPGSGYTVCPGIPSFPPEVILSPKSIGSGSHSFCGMTVRNVSFGMLLRIHCMTAANHASCCGIIWLPLLNDLNIHHHQLGRSGDCLLQGDP